MNKGGDGLRGDKNGWQSRQRADLVGSSIMKPCRVSMMGSSVITQHSCHASMAMPETNHCRHDVLEHLQAIHAQPSQ